MKINKNFYVEHQSVASRSKSENDNILKEMQIKATGDDSPKPITKFEESGLPKHVCEALNNTPNYVKPTAIQAQTWPVALSGKDLVGIAQTGSGKTLAFILPALVHAAD